MKGKQIPLSAIAHSRSGDKGASSNIGVIAFSQEGYELLKQELTESVVAHFFRKLHPLSVRRYELPNLLAFNFILKGVLDGGGSRSLRIDAQGKALGQAILEMAIDIPQKMNDKMFKSSGVNHE